MFNLWKIAFTIPASRDSLMKRYSLEDNRQACRRQHYLNPSWKHCEVKKMWRMFLVIMVHHLQVGVQTSQSSRYITDAVSSNLSTDAPSVLLCSSFQHPMEKLEKIVCNVTREWNLSNVREKHQKRVLSNRPNEWKPPRKW